MPKVLLADDDQRVVQLVSDWLEHHQFTIDIAHDGQQAKEFLEHAPYDVLVLDWDMPLMSGVELCRWFRARGGSTPILMLTGKDTVDDIEAGFDAGADDYLTKPFKPRELTARLTALLRRGAVAVTRKAQVGALTVDPDTHTASLAGTDLKLTATEFAVLEFLCRHPNQVFSADALIDRVWPSSAEISPDTVRVYIKRLREKCSALGHGELIRNVHGVGYKLVPNNE
jgi:DNA-binding response OmpR family regulator